MSHDDQELVDDKWVVEIEGRVERKIDGMAKRILGHGKIDKWVVESEMSHDGQELVDDKWVMEIEGRVERKIDGNREERPSIFGKWKRWDDFGASFIPETQKWIFVACMRHYFDLKLQKYLKDMQKEVDRAWSYYRRVDDQFCTAENSRRFIEHLLVNSCFLIFSMILLSKEESWSECLLGEDFKNIRDFINEDPMRARGYLLTMNYQIPWFVVEAIYNLSNLSNKLPDTPPIHKIAYLFCHGFPPIPPEKNYEGRTHPKGGFKHLLHIFHWYRTTDGMYRMPSNSDTSNSDTPPEGGTPPEGCFKHLLHIFHWSRTPDEMYQMPSNSDTPPEGCFKHLLHIFHWSRTPDGMYPMPSNSDTSNSKRPNWIGRFHIPSATNLQLSQIVFKEDKNHSIDVSYSDSNKLCLATGEMKLTPWRFFQYNIELFESLLRFEQWYGKQCRYPFSSYVTCMASLIKTEEDVRVLRTSDEIIPYTSFDDEAVLHSVQKLKTFIDYNLPMPEELVNLEKEVIAHHEKSVYRIIGDFKKRYCSNTWIIISVIAGILLFVLTFLQTVYGVLSYYI